MVAMDVSATDRQGRPASIAAADLAVFDNGSRQQIELLSAGDRVPLAVALLIDSSQSMYGGLLDHATAAAKALIEQLPADSLIEVLSFSNHAAVRYPLGADHAQAELSLADLSPTGGTALYEAVLVAIRDQERAAKNRVYPVILPPHDAPESGPPWQMTQLALDTGGETIAARRDDDLTSIYREIAADVRNLYRIGYVPSPLVRDGTWHQVQIRAVGKDVILRTRSGYYAPHALN
jgi:hypothetical protein